VDQLRERVEASARYRLKKSFRSPLLLEALTARALRTGFSTAGDVTVVVTNWNTLPYLAVCLHAIRRFSPPDTSVVVVDNGSRDGSRSFLRRQRYAAARLLPVNIDHGPAMDLAFLVAETEYVVALDVDAFPLAPTWLDTLLAPIRSGDATVSGVRVWRSYAHPCAMAMRRERFVSRGHTFRARYRDEDLGMSAWGCGELISLREHPRVALVEPSGSLGPGNVGKWWAGIAYHNHYATRLRMPGGESVIRREGASIDDPGQVWRVAVRRFLDRDADDWESLLDELAP